MLRLLVLGMGALLLGGGLLGLALGAGAGMVPALIFGTLLLGGTIFERHYKPNQTALPGDGFAPTGERFHDPTQGDMVEVWYNQATGERRYVRSGTGLNRRGGSRK
jgi:hypothetical protein